MNLNEALANEPLIQAMLFLAIFGGGCTLLLIGIGIFKLINWYDERMMDRQAKFILEDFDKLMNHRQSAQLLYKEFIAHRGDRGNQN